MEDNRHGKLFNNGNYLIYGSRSGILLYDFSHWFEVDDEIQYFTDDNGNGILGYVGSEAAAGYHACIKSRVWDNLEGYVDTVQHEYELPNGNYIVTYYKCDENLDLLQCVDYGITKEQIIANVEAQKYLEGAEYFLVESMREFVK